MEPAYLSISDFLANENSVPAGKISPYHLADSLEVICNQTLKEIDRINSGKNAGFMYWASQNQSFQSLS